MSTHSHVDRRQQGPHGAQGLSFPLAVQVDKFGAAQDKLAGVASLVRSVQHEFPGGWILNSCLQQNEP